MSHEPATHDWRNRAVRRLRNFRITPLLVGVSALYVIANIVVLTVLLTAAFLNEHAADASEEAVLGFEIWTLGLLIATMVLLSAIIIETGRRTFPKGESL